MPVTRSGVSVMLLVAPWLAGVARVESSGTQGRPELEESSIVHAGDLAGRLHVFAIARDGTVWHFLEPSGKEQWRAQSIGGRASGTPAVVLTTGGRFQVWVVSPDQGLWLTTEKPGRDGWTAWVRQAAPPALEVAATPGTDQRTRVALRGPKGDLWVGSQATGTGPVAKWRQVAGDAASRPVFVASPHAVAMVFARRDGRLFEAGLADLRARPLRAPRVQGAPMTARLLDGTSVLVVQAADGALVAMERVGNGWSKPRTLAAASRYRDVHLVPVGHGAAALIAIGPGGTVWASRLLSGAVTQWVDTGQPSSGTDGLALSVGGRLARASKRMLDNVAATVASLDLVGFAVSIDGITPSPVVEGDTVRVAYTLRNGKFGDPGVGTMKATWDGAPLEAVKTPFVPPLAPGASFKGKFTMGASQHAKPGTHHLQLAYEAGTERVWDFDPALGIGSLAVKDLTQFAQADATVAVLAFSDPFPTDDGPVASTPIACASVGGDAQHTCGSRTCDPGETPQSCPQDCPQADPDVRSYSSLDLCRATSARLAPSKIADVREAIAAAAGAGQRVRMVGNFHSSNPEPCTEGITISTSNLIAPAPWRAAEGDFCDRYDCTADLKIGEPEIETFEGALTVRVGPGLKLHDLNAWLHAAGYSLGYAVLGFREATVGGAIANGTHGSSTRHPVVLSNRVRSLTLALPDGTVREVTGQTAQAPNLEAARVSLGYLGAIVQVRLAIEPNFFLHATTTWMEARRLLEPGAPQSLVQSCDFGELAWFPYGGADDAPVMLFCGNRTDDQGRDENTLLNPPDSDNPDRAYPAVDLMQESACAGSQSETMERTRAEVLRYYMPPISGNKCIPSGTKVGLETPTDVAGSDNFALLGFLSFMTGGWLGAAARHVSDCEGSGTGASYLMMSSDLPPAKFRPMGRDWEVFIPGDKVAAALQLVKTYFEQHDIHMPLFPVFLRFAPLEDGSLIAQNVKQGVFTGDSAGMFLEMPIFVPKSMACSSLVSYEKVYSDLMETLIAPPINGRAHWGKNRRSLFQRQRRLLAYGDNMRRFREAVKQTDPTGVFANQFGVDLGLRWPRLATEVPSDAQTLACIP